MSKPRVDVVSGVLVRGPAFDPKIFLSQRDGDGGREFPYHWELPGGKVHEGESHGEALAREFSEEVGLKVKLIGKCFFQYEVVTSARFMVHFYGVQLVDPNESADGHNGPKLLDVVGAGWFSIPFPTGLPVMPSMIVGADALMRYARGPGRVS